MKLGYRNSLHLILENIARVDYDNAAECVKILVENGCDVNMPNEKSRTPFNLLLRAQPKLKNKHELVDFIMKNSKIDLNTYRAKETIDLFQKNNPHHPMPEHIDTIINYDYMTSLLRQGNESKFCSVFKVFKENEINQQKLNENEENKSNYFAEICSSLLYTAVQNNLEDVVEYLVEEGTDVNRKPDEALFVHSSAHLACSHGNYRILKALFRAEPKPIVNEKGKNLLHIASQHFGMDPSKNPSFSYEKCFYLVLDYCDVNQQDEILFTPLHYAARYRHDKAVVALLKKGSYIGTKGLNGETPIDSMSFEALEEYLDGCITTNTRRHGDEEQEIFIDYSFLKAPKKSSNYDEFGPEIAPLQNIAQNTELKKLVRHPTLASFLFIKWSKLSLMFHSNLIMFSIFMASLIYYIVLSQSLTPEEQSNSALYSIVKIFSFISILMLALRELFQFILSRTIYLRSVINYFEIALIILGTILLFKNHDDDMDYTHLRILRAVTILFAAYEFLQLVGTLPYLSISTHMIILKKVAFTFFRSLLLYSILLLAFALSFYSLFGGKSDAKSNDNSTKTDEKSDDKENDEGDLFNSFSNPGLAIIKTFVMLTGEFDASSLALERNASYSIIFLLFVFLITIVLFNLLNALAIDDTQQIRVEGELVDFCERINLLNKYERIILNCSGWRFIKKYISVFPYTIPKGKIVIHPDKNNEILTYKDNPLTKDVSINITNGDQQELQYLNNNALKRIIPNQRLSAKLEKYYKAIDPKIMKSIRSVLEEKKKKAHEHESSMTNRLISMESEVKMLKLAIKNLCDLIENKI